MITQENDPIIDRMTAVETNWPHLLPPRPVVDNVRRRHTSLACLSYAISLRL
jgi:hypothetical protein